MPRKSADALFVFIKKGVQNYKEKELVYKTKTHIFLEEKSSKAADILKEKSAGAVKDKVTRGGVSLVERSVLTTAELSSASRGVGRADNESERKNKEERVRNKKTLTSSRKV